MQGLHSKFVSHCSILFSLIFLNSSAQASDYVSCLSEKLQGITNDAAVKSITDACKAQYPSNKPANSATSSNGALIDGRYRDNGNGTISDLQTNLTWLRCSLGQQWTGSTCAGVAIEMPWNDLQQSTKGFSYGGYSDWRVPKVEELDTLVWCPSGRKPSYRPMGRYTEKTDGLCFGNEYDNPKIVISAFPNTPAKLFWTSTPEVEDSSLFVWVVSFSYGDVGVGPSFINGAVRLVRTGL